jgi:hypothetical protein
MPKNPFNIALKNILIAVGAAVALSALIGTLRDNWLESFLTFAPATATGLLAVASFWSAREGFDAGQKTKN